MNRDRRRLRRGMIVATRRRRTATEVTLLRRVPNHTAAAVVAVHRHTVAVRPPMVEVRHMKVVATVTQDHLQIPSTASVLAPSLRI